MPACHESKEGSLASIRMLQTKLLSEVPGQTPNNQLPVQMHCLLCSHHQMQELHNQLLTLQAEKQRVEADRQEMALQQGQLKGTVAQVRFHQLVTDLATCRPCCDGCMCLDFAAQPQMPGHNPVCCCITSTFLLNWCCCAAGRCVVIQ